MALPSIVLQVTLSVISLTRLGAAQTQYEKPQGICHQFLDTANATSQDVIGLNKFGLWRVAVHTTYSVEEIGAADIHGAGDPPDVIARLWLDEYDDVNLNDGDNQFSACAYIFKALPENTVRRGQDDDGTCRQTFSDECVEALSIRAATSAQYLVGNPTLGPFNNLTPPILNPICMQIANDIGYAGTSTTATFPEECIRYFDNGEIMFPSINTYALTDNVTKPINCSFYDGKYGPITVLGTSYNAPPGFDFTAEGMYPLQAYDKLVNTVWPVMTVRMPPANNSRRGAWIDASAVMTCLRASTIEADSRTPIPLPAPTPVHVPGKFTKSAIAGIAVASIVGAALIVSGAWYHWRIHKRRTGANRSKIGQEIGSDVTKLAQKDGTEVYQLADGLKPTSQLDGMPRAEIGEDPRQELHGRPVPPQELPGCSPVPSQK